MEEMHEAEVVAAFEFYRAPCRFADLRELHAIKVHEQQKGFVLCVSDTGYFVMYVPVVQLVVQSLLHIACC